MDYAAIEALAKELGFGKIGICSVDGFAAQQKTVEEQPSLRERQQLRFDPAADYPWVQALLVLLWPYQQAPIPQDDEQVFIDSYYYASNRAYQAAKSLEAKLSEAGYHAQANVPFPAKTAALRAGLGVIGDNSLLITPEYGSRIVIILLATDALTPEKADKTEVPACLKCGRCAEVCMAGAITRNGMTHPERCLRNYMLEGSVVPEGIRKKMGMNLIGCDACQRACPMQPRKETDDNDAFYLNDFLTVDEKQFKESVMRLGGVIGRNTARPQRVRAQAALLAGNRQRMQDLEVLRIWEGSEFDAVREHAKWARKEIERHTLGLDQCCEKR